MVTPDWLRIVLSIVLMVGCSAMRSAKGASASNAVAATTLSRTQSTTTAPLAQTFCLSDQAVAYAKRARQIWFDRALAGGAHTWVFNGAETLKALNAYCGDTRLDRELLNQIRFLLAPNRGPTATGGYQDQKQLGATFMFLVAKHTDRIWNQLTANEKTIIDLNMEAHLYSTVFTTKDGVASLVGIDGDTNHGRDWNPNHQNGMIGMIIMTALYWGFDEFETKLAAYEHAAFVARLQAKKMVNLLATYQNQSSPPASIIEAGLRKVVNGSIYAFHGISERNLLGLIGYISDRTFAATIDCGLNGGAGFRGYGKIVRNCSLLPNVGAKGMLKEFASVDGGGRRSSANYSYDGWYPLNYSRAVLQIINLLGIDELATAIETTESASSISMSDILDRSQRGISDLYFKLSPDANKGGGYLEYSNGAPDGTAVLDFDMINNRGGLINLEIFNILQRSLGKPEVTI
jgi:hypothetical protein